MLLNLWFFTCVIIKKVLCCRISISCHVKQLVGLSGFTSNNWLVSRVLSSYYRLSYFYINCLLDRDIAQLMISVDEIKTKRTSLSQLIYNEFRHWKPVFMFLNVWSMFIYFQDFLAFIANSKIAYWNMYDNSSYH